MSETESIEKCDFLDKTITILASKISLNKVIYGRLKIKSYQIFPDRENQRTTHLSNLLTGASEDEFLNVNRFLSLEDAKDKINAFKEDYNHFRAHCAPLKSNADRGDRPAPKCPRISNLEMSYFGE